MLRRVLTAACGMVAVLVLGLIGQQIASKIGMLVLLGPALLGGVTGYVVTRVAVGLWESYDLSGFPHREVLLTAIVFGTVTYACTFFWDYLGVVKYISDQYYVEWAEWAQIGIYPGDPVTTQLTFWHYLQLRMQFGSQLFLMTPGGMKLTGASVCLLWLVEAAAAGYGAYRGYRRVMRPHRQDRHPVPVS
jgi:hypothetical protein